MLATSLSLCAAFCALSVSPGTQEFALQPPLYLTLWEGSGAPALVEDIDGDGWIDVLLAGSAPKRLVRDASGQVVAARRWTSADGIWHHGAHDMDGDGDPDVLALQFEIGSAPRVVWFESRAGERIVDVPRPIVDFPALSSSPTAADLDGDGDVDVMTDPRESGPLRWAENLGGGTFAPEAPLLPQPGPAIGRVSFEDITLDGIGDIVCTGTAGLFILPGLGSGQYGAVEVLDSAWTEYEFRGLSDLDADGVPDLVVSGLGGGLHQLAWLRGRGDGSYEVLQTLFLAPSNRRLVTLFLDDVNGDGLDDVVFVGGSSPANLDPSVFVAFGTGQGSLTSPSILPGTELAGLTPVGLVDLDADGRGDVLHYDADARQLSWSRGVAPSGFAAVEPFLATFGETRFATGDLDGDGDQDVVRAADGLRVLAGEGNGLFREGPVIASNTGGTSRVLLRDLDQDGDLDILHGSLHGMKWSEQTAPMEFGPEVELPAINGVDSSANRPSVADLDGDGLPDLIGGRFDPGWWRNLGGGTFALGRRIGVQPLDLREALVTDLNGDGLSDLVAIPGGVARAIEVFINVTLAPGPAVGLIPAQQVPVSLGTATRAFGLADLDGDGTQDVLVGGATGVLWLRTGPLGLLEAPVEVGSGILAEALIAVADLNGDGLEDLVTRGQSVATGQVATWVHLGLGGSGAVDFGAPIALGEELASLSPDLVAVDVDGDGDRDLVGRTRGPGELAVILNQSRLGVPYCEGGAPNSAGQRGILFAVGSDVPEDDDLELVAEGLPPLTFAMALISRSAAPPTPLASSQGTLCLGAPQGRFNRPGEVRLSDPGGRFELPLDLRALPLASATFRAVPGDTWFFQVWYRDALSSPSSNLTHGLGLRFR